MTDTPNDTAFPDSTGPNPFIRVFGGMGVDDVNGPVSVGGPKQRRLLALLAIRMDSVASNDWLAEYLWDDDDRPEATAPALRTYVSRLRRALPPAAQGWVETESSGYRLSAPAEAVEHRRFAMLRAQATRARGLSDPLTAQNLLDEALAMWRGEPFRELEDFDWAQPEIEQLRLDRLEMMEERWEAVLALGRHTQITGELATFTAEHGLRDRAVRQYALALHRSGRTTEALRVIDEHRRTLADQSGLEPSSAVIELEAALLAGDPSLDVEKQGRPLRGYRLIEEAGTGAFAIVWRALQPSVDRQVAIKQIRSELVSQPDFIRRFEAEARLVARIEHPHIVPLIDYWRDPDSAYLVMRWLPGGTLERRLDDGYLTVDETLRLASQIGSALSAAHVHGVVHRDVKAGNILFDDTDNAFLGDFGIALEATKSSGPEAALSPGSPAYSSPEQIRRESLGPEADVFSLGVVLFECLSGSLPFSSASSLDELIDQQLHMEYPLLTDLRPDVPGSVSDAVAKATAKNPDERFASVEEFLDALLPGPVAAPGDAMPIGGPMLISPVAANPYMGLRAFDDGDADQFFGRESLVRELVARLARSDVSSRCVVVVGPSGSGKSSVVRAGLTPAIRAGAVAGSDDWFITTMVPGADPFESLEAALLRVAVNPPPTLLEQLRDGDRGILRSVRRCLSSDNDRALVVIDQFEEVFTRAAAKEADDFLDALAVAVEDPTSQLRVVITLRADYYHRPLEHPAFARILKATAVDVTPLAPNELEQAIVEPARRAGATFEAGLVARIAAEATGQSSPLPLLQYALSELFEKRDANQLTSEAYDEIGGLVGALAARAEAIYADASEPERAAIRRIFGRMTNAGDEAADLRRRVPVGDLGDDPSATWVLDRFGSSRLVTFDRDVATREPTVEVAHEALLREWPRLVAWLAEDVQVLQAADAVANAASVWDHGGRVKTDLYRGGRLDNAVDLALTAPNRLRHIDSEFIDASRASAEEDRGKEQSRVRRLRRLVAGVGVALVIAVIAAGVAIREQGRADDEAEAAQIAQAGAEEQTRIAEDKAEEADLATLMSRSAAVSAEEPEISLLLALEAHRRAPGAETEQAVLNALGSSTIANRVSSLGPLNDPSGPCGIKLDSPDGTREFAVVNGVMISRDALTGIVVEHGAPPAPCVAWVGDEQAGRRVAGSEDGLQMWFGPYDGPWQVEKEFEEPTFFISEFIYAENRQAVVSFPSDVATVSLLDTTTGEPVATPISGGDQLVDAAVSADGSLFALSFGTLGRAGGDGKTIIVDSVSGTEISNFNSPQPARALEFDTATGELIAATIPRTIMTVDPATSAVLASVEATTTSDVLDIGVRPDGLIAVVSNGQYELVDRRSGPTGTPLALRDLLFAIVRPDGTLFTVNAAEDTAGVLDPDGNALIERTFAIDPFVKVAFNGNQAGTIAPPTGNMAEVIDLSTGERSTSELFTPQGDRFVPHSVYPESNGLWAIGFQNVFARWEGDQLVEQFDLGGDVGTGTRYADVYAYIWIQPNGNRVASLVNLEHDKAGVVFTVPAPEASTTIPTLDGGMHVVDEDGTLHTYDASGSKIGEFETGAEFVNIITIDPATGRLALAGTGGVVIADPATGTAEAIPGIEKVSNLGFADDGRLLAISSFDGTVRLWDLVRGASAGLVWDGSGAVVGSPSWYDEATDSIWAASSGKLLQIPVNADRWIERACEVVGREFTQDEWDRYVPGDEPLQPACG